MRRRVLELESIWTTWRVARAIRGQERGGTGRDRIPRDVAGGGEARVYRGRGWRQGPDERSGAREAEPRSHPVNEPPGAGVRESWRTRHASPPGRSVAEQRKGRQVGWLQRDRLGGLLTGTFMNHDPPRGLHVRRAGVCQAPLRRATADDGAPFYSSIVVSRTTPGSVNSSRWSRLVVENSLTTAPSGPDWNQCQRLGSKVYCSPGLSAISFHTV